MSVALKLYEQLTDAQDDKTRARLIAEAFEAVEARYPEIKDLATQSHIRESEMRLQKEILTTQGHIRETELRLQKEIKEVEARLEARIKEIEAKVDVRFKEVDVKFKEVEARFKEVDAKIKESELRLQKEIREVELRLQKEIKAVEVKLGEVEVRLTRAIHRQTVWVVGAVGAVVGLIRLLDHFL